MGEISSCDPELRQRLTAVPKALHQCEADVQIYEEAAAPGGHANTAYVQSTGKHPSVAVDTYVV